MFTLEEREAKAEMIMLGSVLEPVLEHLQAGLRSNAHEPAARVYAFLGAMFLTNRPELRREES